MGLTYLIVGLMVFVCYAEDNMKRLKSNRSIKQN
jgi:hypothetical protein